MFIKERKSLSKLRPVFKKMDQSGGMDIVRVAIYITRCLVKLYYRELVKVGWQQSEEK